MWGVVRTLDCSDSLSKAVNSCEKSLHSVKTTCPKSIQMEKVRKKGVLNMTFNVAVKCVCCSCSIKQVNSLEAQINSIHTGF